jgi:sporulation protein YlmC with PRC-barrel domain
MSEVANVREWIGQEVLDADGDKLGKLEDVYVDAETDEPLFALVKTGRLGRRTKFVPLDGYTVGRDHVQVRRPREEIDNAPELDSGDELSPEAEERVFRYYGLDYAPADTQSGRRLVRR